MEDKNLWLEMMREVDWIFENYASQLPFGNSHVQNMLNIVSEEMSPARRLRAYLLRLWDRKRAMDEALFNLKKTEIKLKKLSLRLEQEQDEMERELIELQIEKHLNDLKYLKKMFYDCVAEIKGLCKVIKEMKPITREEFERQEFEHFKERLINRLQYPPEVATLSALGMKVQISGDEIKALPNPEFIENTIKKVKEVQEEIKKLPPVMDEMIIALKETILQGLPKGSKVLELPQSKEEG